MDIHIAAPDQNKTSAPYKPLYPLPPPPRVIKILTSISIDLFLPPHYFLKEVMVTFPLKSILFSSLLKQAI